MELEVPFYIKSLIPYVPGKPIEEAKRELKIKKIAKLASNENPLGPSPKAVRAIQGAMKSLHRYPDGGGYRLKKALSEKLDIAPSRLILGNGSNEIIDQLIRTYCLPGDTIVTPEAAFIAYQICAQIHGVETHHVKVDSSFSFRLDEMIQFVKRTPKARMIFLANPNNPTGTYLNKDLLKHLTQELQKIRGGSTLLVLDSAYVEYVTAKDFPNPMDVLGYYPNTVVLRTFSKIYGLAGLRLGYGIASQDIISHLEKVRQPFNVSSLALAGGEAALQDTAFVKRSKQANLQSLNQWEKALEQLSIPYFKSQGNFILADVAQGLGMTGPEAYEASLKRGVIFRPLANYGLKNMLRISMGVESENEWAFQVLRKIR